MNKITQNQCQEFRKYLIENVASTNSARTIWSGFKVVINYAKNTLDYVQIQQYQLNLFHVKPKPKFMMREEFEERIKDIEDQDYRELFTLMFYTGLRIGEAMALVWTDYNKYKKRYP